MTTDRKLSLFLDNQIPDYVQEFYPLFVVFVTKYFEWLEQEGNPQDVIQTIQLNRDIDTVASSLVVRFLNNYMPELPNEFTADKEIVVKYMRDFYERKGSENSFKFFFKAFFNDDVTITRPSESVFKLSDSKWLVRKKLRALYESGNPLNLRGATIVGSSTGAKANIDDIVQINISKSYDILLQNNSLVGTFNSSETLVAYYWNFDTDTSSQVTLINTEPVVELAGRTLDSRSQLSSDQKLQDSFYYHNFAYVINSQINRDRWQRAILDQLHPAGHASFNNRIVAGPAIAVTSTFVRTTTIESSVQFYTEKDFYIDSGYTFDRLADFRTGTSATTTAGAITYAADYAYQGENVTFGLQKGGDDVTFGTNRVQIVGSGATFDKVGAGVKTTNEMITFGNNVDSSQVTQYLHTNTTLSYTSGQTIVTGSIYDFTSCLLIITWMKDPSGNAASEATNALTLAISSTVGMVTLYDAEIQRNYRDLALGDSLFYKDMTYYNSSNTLTNISGDLSGSSIGASIVTQFNFIPYNVNRSQSFSRAVIKINADFGCTVDFSLRVSSGSATFNARPEDHLNVVVVGATL